MTYLRTTALLSVATLAITFPATAQNEYFSRDKYEAVTDRQQPDYDPDPIRAGAYTLRPRLEAGVTSTSNVFTTNTDEQSDTIVRYGAAVDAGSNWSNHAVFGSARAFRSEYSDTDTNSFSSFDVDAGADFDVNRQLTVGPRVAYSQGAESRADFVNAVGTERPVEVESVSAALAGRYQTGRLRVDAEAGVRESDYEDVPLLNTPGTFDQDFRDRTYTYGRSRVSYAVNPDIAVFAQSEIYETDYDQTQLIASVERSRDSSGYIASAGVNFELQSLVRGDIAVGHFSDEKDDSFFNDTSGLSVDGRATWFVTRLTNVTGRVGRRFVDNGLTDSSSAVQTSYEVRVDHELRRNIILSANARFSDDDYDDIDRTDENTEFGVEGLYKLNRNVHFEAFARHEARDASGAAAVPGLSFDNNLFGIGIRVFP